MFPVKQGITIESIMNRSNLEVCSKCNLNQFTTSIHINKPTNKEKRNYTDKLSQEYKEEYNEEYQNCKELHNEASVAEPIHNVLYNTHTHSGHISQSLDNPYSHSLQQHPDCHPDDQSSLLVLKSS